MYRRRSARPTRVSNLAVHSSWVEIQAYKEHSHDGSEPVAPALREREDESAGGENESPDQGSV
jgi:hypothetical protein